MSKKLNTSIAKIKNSSGEFEPMAALVGQSPYELAVEAGFEGTEQEWLEMMIGNGWVGAFQDLKKADEAMQEVISKIPETYAAKKEVEDLSDITVPIVSNIPPTENDEGVPGKIWTVPHIIFKNLFNKIWTLSGATSVNEGDIYTFKGDGSSTNIEAVSELLENSTAGHITYFKATCTAVDASNEIRLQLLAANNSVVHEEVISVPDLGAVTNISAYFTASANISKLKVVSAYNTASTQLDKSVSISNIILVDLTSDMTQSKHSLEFTEEEAVEYFKNITTFIKHSHKNSEWVWVCRGINDEKYKWVRPVNEAAAHSAYLTFVGNVNTDIVSAALGKNNEDRIQGVGLALAMYTKYKDPTIVIENVFENIMYCDTITQITKNINSLIEFINNDTLFDFLYGNEYFMDTCINAIASASATTSTSSNAAASSSTTVTITEEHINGSKLLILYSSYYHNRAYGSCYATLNGVDIFRIGPIIQSKVNKSILNLNDFNITEPGDYTIYVYAGTGSRNDRGNSTVYIYEVK